MSAQDDANISDYAEYAPAIGWMSMQWSYLEAIIDRHLLRALIPLDPSDVCNIVTSNIDFRAKIQIAIKLAHLKKPDDRWYNELEAVLNLVDNELRNKRNRYIHDTFVTQLKSNPVVRAQTKAVLKKPQSHKALELTTYHEIPTSPDEIWKTADEITAAARKIGLLVGRLRKALRAPSP